VQPELFAEAGVGFAGEYPASMASWSLRRRMTWAHLVFSRVILKL
jgi:hypothetical protein